MDNGRLAVVSIRSAFRVDGPFEDAGEPRSRLGCLQARRSQREGGGRGGIGGRYLFGGRFPRVRYRSEAGGLYRIASDCPVPVVVFVLLFKRREGRGGELDGIGRVIGQRLRRRYRAAEKRQHVEGQGRSKGACSPPLPRGTVLRGRGGTVVCGQWGQGRPEGCNTRDGTGPFGGPRPPERGNRDAGEAGARERGINEAAAQSW